MAGVTASSSKSFFLVSSSIVIAPKVTRRIAITAHASPERLFGASWPPCPSGSPGNREVIKVEGEERCDRTDEESK